MDRGHLPNGWKVKKLGEVYDVRDGTHDSPKYLSEGYPLITSKNLKPNGLSFENIRYISEIDFNKINERSLVHKGDVLVAMIGTIGNPTIVELEPNFAIKNVALMKVINNQNSYFLKYYLETNYVRSKMQREAKGTTQKFVGLGYLRDFPMICPPINEQKQIVAILDEAFEGIDQAIRNTEKNLANARELFDSYLNKIFTQKGDGWEEGKLGQIATFRNGLNFTKSSKGESIKIVGVKDFQNHFYIQENQLESVTIDADLKEIDILRKGDILTVRSNGNKELIGRCVLADNLLEKTSHSGFTIRIRIEKENIYPSFIVYFLKSKDLRKQLAESGGGISISSLNQESLSQIKINFPSLVEQKFIVQNINELDAETQRLEIIYRQKLAALNELKQSILQKAFTGQLTK